jgi:hypothetical protein
MPLTLSIGGKLGIYAVPAEIPPRPDGGLPGPTPFAPQTVLALPRWVHSEYTPSLSWQYNLPWGQGIQPLPSGAYGRDYHCC